MSVELPKEGLRTGLGLGVAAAGVGEPYEDPFSKRLRFTPVLAPEDVRLEVTLSGPVDRKKSAMSLVVDVSIRASRATEAPIRDRLEPPADEDDERGIWRADCD